MRRMASEPGYGIIGPKRFGATGPEESEICHQLQYGCTPVRLSKKRIVSHFGH